MKSILVKLALVVGLISAPSAFAYMPVCNYAAGETLLAGPITSDTYSNINVQYLPNGRTSCSGTETTTQGYACQASNGTVTQSGTLTVTRTNVYAPCPQF